MIALYQLPLVFALAGLAFYVVLGGADFGAGFWQLLAGPGERGAPIRDHAHEAMAPVWEANHVWLIFVLTVTWTAYPSAFGAIAKPVLTDGQRIRYFSVDVAGNPETPHSSSVAKVDTSKPTTAVPSRCGRRCTRSSTSAIPSYGDPTASRCCGRVWWCISGLSSRGSKSAAGTSARCPQRSPRWKPSLLRRARC